MTGWPRIALEITIVVVHRRQAQGAPEEIEKSIDRIREKTERALTTLAESPFTAAISAVNEDTRDEVLRELD